MRIAFVSWRDYYGKLWVFATRCEGFPPACLRILVEAQVEGEKRERERKQEELEDVGRKDPRPW